ncbi:MAG: hypothetical protein ACR2JC_20265 [Chloroflexota bacterium]|nr:MAG: hypothetical protein DLM70_04970 [Chloroflexota bacterium]
MLDQAVANGGEDQIRVAVGTAIDERSFRCELGDDPLGVIGESVYRHTGGERVGVIGRMTVV